jgi:hypothetical protein
VAAGTAVARLLQHPQSHSVDATTGRYEGGPTRSADVYVFCHYPERDKASANILDVPAWDFYVVPVQMLDREYPDAKSISLTNVRRIGAACKFGTLRQTLDPALLNCRRRDLDVDQ